MNGRPAAGHDQHGRHEQDHEAVANREFDEAGDHGREPRSFSIASLVRLSTSMRNCPLVTT